MKVLILAGGFGTRLQQDLKSKSQLKYKHLIGISKPLLPIAGKPLVTHWMSLFETCSDIQQVYIVTNDINHGWFTKWAENWPSVIVFSDRSLSNDTKIGAVGCIKLTVEHFNIAEDILIVAGDTLFYEDFNLKDMMNQFRRYKAIDNEANMVLYVKCRDDEVQISSFRHGGDKSSAHF